MSLLDEAISEVVRDAPPTPALHALRRRTRRRRITRGATAVVVAAIASAGVAGVARSVGHDSSSPDVQVAPPPTSASANTPPTSGPNPRSAAANAHYVEQLVAERRLPHSTDVTKVEAVGDRIVLRTSLTDTTPAQELWEGLARVIDCDDSYMLIRGHAVVLGNGSQVNAGRRGFRPCVEGDGPALEVPPGTRLCRASDLEVAPGSSLLLIRLLNRGGTSCGLAGYVSVYGRVDGQWSLLESVPLGTTVTNGPRWTGVFDPNLTAVISVDPTPAFDCVATSARSHYTGLRLALPRGAGTIDIDTIQFDVSNCPLSVSPVEADSQDN
ncbi:MAG: hypothetical protein QOE62_528 [Actinomycetota bacterium]|nr:hypothetical protein [Actinomycetota bacterium]